MTETISQEATGKAEVPATWVWSEIGNIAELVRGVSYKKADASTSPRANLTPILRANNIANNRLNFDELVYVPPQAISEKQYVRALDIVIAMSSGSKKLVGKAGQATNDYGCAFGAFCGLIRGSELLDKKYVGLFFQSELYTKAISRLSSGVNINNLRRQHIEEMPIPLAPLNEQRRIVEKIEELFTKLDAGIRSMEQVRAQLKSYRRSVLKAAVEGELSREWREAHKGELEPASKLLERILREQPEKFTGKKYREPGPPDTLNLPALPNGWAWASLDQLGEVIGGLTKNRKRETYPSRFPYLRVANVYANELRLNDVEEIGVEDSELDRVLLKNEDLLVVEGNGSPDQIGRVALWNGSISPCVHQNHIIKIRFIRTNTSRYALYWLLSVEGRGHIKRVASSTSGLYTLSLSKVKALPIPLPPPQEQSIIVEEVERRLSVVEKLEETVEANLKQAHALRQSILKQAFSGELVPQDPDDEPASALLERIREERQDTKQKVGRGRRDKIGLTKHVQTDQGGLF